MGKEELIACFQDTVEKSNDGSLKQRTARAIRSNRVYKEGFVSKVKHRSERASIDVYSGTTFDIAKRYRSRGKIAVLNFANPECPGGGVQIGAMAQEECLCRSSNLFACIANRNVYDEYYVYHRNGRSHFYTNRLIYTKDVTVFKNDSLIPKMLPEDEWFNVDVITCAAPYLAKRKHTNGAALFELFKSRIKNIFEAARDNKVDYLILGAFGCGAFKNPPLIVAEAFLQTIKEQNYFRDFKQIVFAIKPTGEDCPNLSTFSRQFDSYALDAGERCVLLSEPLEWRLQRNPKLTTESRFSDNREFKSWQLENRYFGKQFSILGDSISTLDGYNPKGYKVFYMDDNCVKSDVIEVEDTWWDKVIGFFGGELLVNNSWSGSRVTKLEYNEQLFPSGCSDERTSALHINDVRPDVILVYLGTNDWANGVPTLKYWENSGDYENWLGTMLLPNEKCFDVAYEQMLTKLRANYPNTEIFCCTLCETFISKRPDFKFPHKYAGTHIEEYNEIIRNIVRRNGCRLIDLYSYKIAYDSIDGSHPTSDGMNTLATLMIRSMSDEQGGKFLNCEENEHDYIVIDEFTGNPQYVCRKCGKYKHSETYNYVLDSKAKIEKMELSYGDFPIHNVKYESGKVTYYNRIHGSRDGGRNYPEKFFDEKTMKLTDAEIEILNVILNKVKLAEYVTDAFPEITACGAPSREDKYLKLSNGNEYELENTNLFAKFFDELCEFEEYLLPECDNEKVLIDGVAGGRTEVLSDLPSDNNIVTGERKRKCDTPENLIGKEIGGRYKLLKLVGRGGISEVYLAIDMRLNKTWAIKACRKIDCFALTAVLSGATMMKQLNHEGLPMIVDIIDEEQYLFIVMEYVEGVTIDRIIREYGPQPEENVVEWAKQVCGILGYLHTLNPPHIHRDIKPANLMLTPAGKVKLIDFSIMNTYDPNKSFDEVALGTVGYASPEGFHGQTDPRSDIYSLGVTMHEILTGVDPKQPLYELKSISQVNPLLSKGLEYIISKCIELDPKNRYQSSFELNADLNQYKDLPKSKSIFGRLFEKLFEK